MELAEKCFRIAGRMAAWMTGSATEEDIREAEEWKQENERNVPLWDELTQGNAFDENQRMLVRFPVDEAWEKIRGRLGHVSIRRGKVWGWMKYAAVVVVCLGCGALYFLLSNRPEVVSTTIVSAAIPAGKQGARLTLGNGQVMNVLPEATFTIAEADGTLIRKGAEGIDYTQARTEGDALVYNQMETLTGMEYMLTLADGTRVYLNAESRIKFPATFRGNRREVELQGEAYFKVAEDASRPFIVKMLNVEVKVVGTSFNVRSYANEPEIVTTLVEGKVEMNGRRVLPGEQAQYTCGTGEMTVRPVDTELYTSWREGRFVFRNERLEDIMRTLSRWYGVEYHFMDQEVKEVRIGASFGRYEDMNPIIDMLKQTELVDVLQTNKGLYIGVKK